MPETEPTHGTVSHARETESGSSAHGDLEPNLQPITAGNIRPVLPPKMNPQTADEECDANFGWALSKGDLEPWLWRPFCYDRILGPGFDFRAVSRDEKILLPCIILVPSAFFFLFTFKTSDS